MALKKPHSEWRLDTISPIDVRAVGLDQLLTQLWLRVLFDNRALVSRAGIQTVAELANEIERRRNAHFEGFDSNPGAADAWLRGDLVKTLRRSPEKFTVARPVHQLATRVRSVNKQTDDSAASAAVYAWLERVDKSLLRELREFINVDVAREPVDMATLALALLGMEQEPDTPRSDDPQPTAPPLCLGQPKTYADDLRRLLAYRKVMPRSALVDHIRRLTGFHVGLYLLRVFRIVVEAERNPDGERTCRTCPGRVPRGTGCPHRLELLVDCGEDARSPVARLAEDAWSAQEDHLARYVRSHLALKKLHEFATYLHEKRREERVPKDALDDIARVENAVRGEVVDLYFDQRLESLIEQTSDPDAKNRLRDLERDYRAMGLSSFRTYVAVLTNSSERRWFNYHRYLLDSLFSKNTADGLLRQPLGGRRRRRAAMGAGLLETLTLIAVVAGDPGSYFTRPLRVDELIERIEGRYGLLIGTPPASLVDDIEVSRLLADNVERFKGRLRETGLFTDLSDAFLAQLVRPRHVLGTAA